MEVNLTKRVTTPAGKRYYPVVLISKTRIKPDWVYVNGAEEKHPEGAYYLEWTEKGKRKRQSVGKDAQQAFARKVRKHTTLVASVQGITVVPETSLGLSLSAAITEYLEETRISRKPKTLAAYRVALEYLMESCGDIKVADVGRRQLLQFTHYLRTERGQSPRSTYNKFENVMTFLKAQGVRDIVGKNDWPRFVEEEPEIYEKEDLDKLLSVCLPHEKLWWEFFLMTGMREQEVVHTTWQDVNFTDCVIRMRWKPKYDWTPKAYKERSIPVPERLIEGLQRIKPVTPSALLFPTAGNRPKLDFLDCLKRCARRASMPVEEWYLHRFRATFATWHLWEGIDLRTVQLWLGHTDMESTLRYLKPSRSQATRDKVNATFSY